MYSTGGIESEHAIAGVDDEMIPALQSSEQFARIQMAIIVGGYA
jgi:hypothetical protein